MSRLKDMKVLTATAMLSAVAIALGFFKLPIGQLIEIRFSTLPIAIAGFLFGPAIGGLVGAISDIGGYIVRPTGAYAPGFTLDTILTGVIFGLVLYKKNLSVKRLIIANVINSVLINTLMNSFWLAILYKLPFVATMITRIPKEVIMLPINIILLTVILKPLQNLSIAKLQTNK